MQRVHLAMCAALAFAGAPTSFRPSGGYVPPATKKASRGARRKHPSGRRRR